MAADPNHKDFEFVFIYTREAHPGDPYGAHATFSQKMEHARAFRERWKVRRAILTDDLEGTVHRAYGSLPNMAYIIGRGGRIAFRSNWTDAHTLRWAMEYLRHEIAERQKRERPAPFYAEILGHRSATDYPQRFVRGLWETGGSSAVNEYILAVAKGRTQLEADQLQAAYQRLLHRE